MLSLYQATREAVVRQAIPGQKSFTVLGRIAGSVWPFQVHSKRLLSATPGSGDKESPSEGLESGTDQDILAQRFQFPDPTDPHQHPLASMMSEDVEERREYLKKVNSTNKPPVYKRKVNENGEAYAIGSRKRSKAKVWLRPGTGDIVVNGRSWVDYFRRLDHRDKILKPFGLLHLTGSMDVTCEVKGGGTTGQAEAFRHALARALQNWNPEYRPTMKENGFLTRDSREVEPKKYGRKKARKSFQWVKR